MLCFGDAAKYVVFVQKLACDASLVGLLFLLMFASVEEANSPGRVPVVVVDGTDGARKRLGLDGAQDLALREAGIGRGVAHR